MFPVMYELDVILVNYVGKNNCLKGQKLVKTGYEDVNRIHLLEDRHT